jgi:hypothetical protein
MKSTADATLAGRAGCPDADRHEQAVRLGGAYARERDAIQAALVGLETLRYVDRPAREANALATMEPMPGHEHMDRAPREVLRLRAALFLLSCHEHRKN